jgi:SEC-C motif
MEMFCTEPDCDCRNAIISVGRDDEQDVTLVAQLRFCWEEEQYYQSINFDFDTISSFPGVAADIMSPLPPYLPGLISYFKMLCEEDGQPFASPYATRIKDHYRQFKEEIKRRPFVPPPFRTKNTMSRNASCSCGSGRKHKKCCL